MRVITGSARGRRLITPDGYDTRPTGEKMKEALFSAIHFDLENKRVLDLFAGSGQLGIEALSRGASYCVFIDNGRAATEAIKSNLEATGLIKSALVSAMDAEMFLSHSKDKFDIVLLDPPYKKGILLEIEDKLKNVIDENSIIICETSRDEELPDVYASLPLYRDKRFGDSRLRIYRAVPKDIY